MADLNNPNRHQAGLEAHKEAVDSQQKELEQLLIRVAEMASKQHNKRQRTL